MLIASDLHIDNHRKFASPDTDSRYPGCNSRAVVILDALERVYEKAISLSETHVVIPGDVFHRRGILLVPLLNALHKLFERYFDLGIQTIVLPGNHDYVDKNAQHAASHLHALYSLKNSCVVISEPKVMVFPDNLGLFIPYTPSRLDWLAKAKDLVIKAGKLHHDRPLTIFAHQSFSGARTGPHEYIMEEGIDPYEVPPEANVISGHYHMNQTLGSVTYVGSLVQHDFGERAYAPGYLYLSGETLEFIENTVSPRFVIYEGNDVEKIKETIVKPDYLQIQWSGSKEDSKELKEALKDQSNIAVLGPVSMEKSRLELSGSESKIELLTKYVGLGVPDGLALDEVLAEGINILETEFRGGRV